MQRQQSTPAGRPQRSSGARLRAALSVAATVWLAVGCACGGNTHAAPAQPVPAHSVAAPARAAAGIPELLAAARQAYVEHHVVAPTNHNAMQDYEAVLDRDPDNAVARNALREIFPYAVPYVEATIARGDSREAEREIRVLSKADPANATVPLLRSMLDARRAK